MRNPSVVQKTPSVPNQPRSPLQESLVGAIADYSDTCSRKDHYDDTSRKLELDRARTQLNVETKENRARQKKIQGLEEQLRAMKEQCETVVVQKTATEGKKVWS